MFKNSLAALIAALGSTLAYGELSGEDLTRQLAYSALHLADWQQTRRIAASGGKWIETNPILGERPTQAQVNRYFLATLAAHWAVTYHLPKSYRRDWQLGTITLQAIVVRNNYQLGISASF